MGMDTGRRSFFSDKSDDDERQAIRRLIANQEGQFSQVPRMHERTSGRGSDRIQPQISTFDHDAGRCRQGWIISRLVPIAI